MRYSNVIGIIISLLLIIACFIPWVYIPAIRETITGFYAEHTNFGRPGLMHCILGALSVLLFVINNTATRRANIFICTLNFAWSLRNYLLLTRCEMGECPEKRYGIYLMLCFSFIMLVMSLIPYEQKLKNEINSI